MDKISNRRRVVPNLVWSIKTLCRFSVPYFIYMILDAIIRGISPVVSLLLTQQMINMIQLRSGTWEEVLLVLIALTVFGLFSAISLNFTQLKLSNYELKFDAHFQVKILDKISVLSSKDFENSKTYNLINRTQYDANAGILGNIKTFFAILSLAISTISYIAIIIKYNVLIFFIIILIPIIRYLFEKKYNLLEYDQVKKNTEPERRTSYIAYLLTNAEYFKEIKMFKLFTFFIKSYEKVKSSINIDFIKLHNKRAKVYSILTIVETAVDFFVTVKILIQTFGGTLLIGQFILYSNSIDSLKENVDSLFSQISLIYKNSAIVEQIREYFELHKESINEDGIQINSIKNIRLENISYKYGGKEEYTLKDINLNLSSGDFTVFMGENGSGKSTLMKIIMGIYLDYEGDIYVDDINLKQLNLNSYRNKVGTLFQDYIKYESSVADNIWYGNLEYKNNSSKLDELLAKVNLEEFLKNKEQVLGYQFNDGRQISIGQWQKLALGRTMAKEADIYIFDEPNSALDLISEDAILSSIYNGMKNKIIVLIMHRFNHIISKANKIVILDNGHIEEIGTHVELMNNKGIYHKLYSIQTSNT